MQFYAIGPNANELEAKAQTTRLTNVAFALVSGTGDPGDTLEALDVHCAPDRWMRRLADEVLRMREHIGALEGKLGEATERLEEDALQAQADAAHRDWCDDL